MIYDQSHKRRVSAVLTGLLLANGSMSGELFWAMKDLAERLKARGFISDLDLILLNETEAELTAERLMESE